MYHKVIFFSLSKPDEPKRSLPNVLECVVAEHVLSIHGYRLFAVLGRVEAQC